MKYIDSDKLIAALERQNADKKIIQPVIRIINSLQQEQPEVDLEKEIDNVIADYSFTKTIDSGGFKTTFLDYAKIARHFYELGLNARSK